MEPKKKRTNLERALERVHGKPLEQIVRDTFADDPSLEEAAVRIGVSYNTARIYRRRFVEPLEEQEVCAAPAM